MVCGNEMLRIFVSGNIWRVGGDFIYPAVVAFPGAGPHIARVRLCHIFRWSESGM